MPAPQSGAQHRGGGYSMKALQLIRGNIGRSRIPHDGLKRTLIWTSLHSPAAYFRDINKKP